MAIPILHKPHTDADALEVLEDGAEARMRQALGQLGTARAGKPEALRRASYQATPGAGRHRFRRDGEVPVVRISLSDGARGKGRLAPASIEPGNAVEPGRGQGSGESARQVQELAEQLRTALTRLGHAELALAEAGRAAQARQDETAGLRHALAAAEATLIHVRAELAARKREREDRVQRRVTTLHSCEATGDRKDMAPRRQVGRPLGALGRARREAAPATLEPVKWWAGD